MGKKRDSMEITVEILQGARKGNNITQIAKEHGYSRAQKYLSALIESGLLEVKDDNLLVSKDGRKFHILYVTTEKGLKFLDSYNNLLKFLGA